MSQSIVRQAAALALSAAVTLSLLAGVGGLAAAEQVAAQAFVAQTQATPVAAAQPA